jgi:protein-disulfide isomerase
MSRLTVPLSDRDHIQGSLDAEVELVEYGDYECPHCTAAFPVVKQIQAEFGDDLCFAYRHFPLVEIHQYAEPAAEAAEAAGAQRRFWQMHDLLFENSPELDGAHLLMFANTLRLDTDRFIRDVAGHGYLPRIREDIESGVASGVRGTPTFFINGVRHQGGYDLETMREALQLARRVAH